MSKTPRDLGEKINTVVDVVAHSFENKCWYLFTLLWELGLQQRSTYTEQNRGKDTVNSGGKASFLGI